MRMKRILFLSLTSVLPLLSDARHYLGDVNHDGKVDVADLLMLQSQILSEADPEVLLPDTILIPDTIIQTETVVVTDTIFQTETVVVTDTVMVINTIVQSTYANPVFAYDWPDPTVWQGDDQRFYTYSTAGTTYNKGLGKMLWSDDMVRWDTITDVVLTPATLQTLRSYGQHLWAPQILKVQDRWLMYLSCHNTEKDCAIVVLSFPSATFPSADGKCGPWTFERMLVSSKTTGIDDTIDPCVVTDHEDGRLWLYFGSVGRQHRVELSADGLSTVSQSPFVHTAGLKIAQSTTRERVFEGAYLYYREPYWYYFVSSGQYADYTYALKVGRSLSLTGTFSDRNGRPMTEGNGTVLLSTPDARGDFWGPGHCGEIFTDAIGQTYMFYHSHSRASGKDSRRSLMLQRIYWDADGWPYFTDAAPQGTDLTPAISSLKLP